MRNAELLTPRCRAYYMAMLLTLPHYTIADLDQFPEDGNRYEVLAGMLLVTPGLGVRHQTVLSRLFTEVALYLEPAGLAYPVSRGVVPSGLDTQLQPDLLVIPSRYFGAEWPHMSERWLAVEVSGRDSRVYDRDYKRKPISSWASAKCGASISAISWHTSHGPVSPPS